MKPNECAGLLGRFFGHKFQAREEIRPYSDEVLIAMISAEGTVNLDEETEYLFDICTRCGLKVDRSALTSVKCENCGGFTAKG